MNEFALRFHHGALGVPNLNESIAWYEKMLGFTVEQRFEIPGQDVEIAMMKLDDMRVELFEAKNSKPMDPSKREPNTAFRSQGSLHFSFAAPNVRPLAETLRARGVDIVWIQDFPWGSNAFIRDNAGNLIEIVQESRPA
jgi:methylmalonyl-CoA/ethylmalonyl-CoA epimerase